MIIVEFVKAIHGKRQCFISNKFVNVENAEWMIASFAFFSAFIICNSLNFCTCFENISNVVRAAAV